MMGLRIIKPMTVDDTFAHPIQRLWLKQGAGDEQTSGSVVSSEVTAERRVRKELAICPNNRGQRGQPSLSRIWSRNRGLEKGSFKLL